MDRLLTLGIIGHGRLMIYHWMVVLLVLVFAFVCNYILILTALLHETWELMRKGSPTDRQHIYLHIMNLSNKRNIRNNDNKNLICYLISRFRQLSSFFLQFTYPFYLFAK